MNSPVRILFRSFFLLILFNSLGLSQGFSGIGLYAEGGLSKGSEPFYNPVEWNYLMVPKFEGGVFTTFGLAPRVYFSTELNYKFFRTKRELVEPNFRSTDEKYGQRVALGLKADYYFREMGTQVYCWGGVGLGINTKVDVYIKTYLPSSVHILRPDPRYSIGKVQSNVRFGLGTGKLIGNQMGLKFEFGVDCLGISGVARFPFSPCLVGRAILELKKKKEASNQAPLGWVPSNSGAK